MEKLKDRFGAIKTLKADYVRDLLPKVSSALPSAPMKAEGQLTFASPNKLRLDQRKPRAELLISNGEKAWWYIPGEKTVQIFQVKEYGQTGQAHHRVFLRPGRSGETFYYPSGQDHS